MADTIPILEPQPSGAGRTPPARLEGAARVAASWDVVRQPSSIGSFSRRIQAASQGLARLERFIAERNDPRTEKGAQTESAASSLREVRTHLRSLSGMLSAITGSEAVIERLPHILFSSGREEPRIAAVARIYLDAVDSVFDPGTFSTFLRILQTREPLTLDELANISSFLQFILLESLLSTVRTWRHSTESESSLDLSRYLSSLTAIRRAGWADLIEPLIVFDGLLRQDPAGAYERMDSQSRELYRQRVAFLARRSDCTEVQVAQAALDLAVLSSQRSSGDAGMRLRRAHVGYYLIDKGFPSLALRIGFHPSMGERVRRTIREHADDFYIGGILALSCIFVAFVLFPVLPQFSSLFRLIIALIALLPPAMQCAVDLVNQAVTALFDPEPLPKLDFSKAIPPDCETLVAVPSLLLSEKHVRKLIHNLEVSYLANRERHLHFALLADLPDSHTKPREQEVHPLVQLAVQMIDELNTKYPASQGGTFMLLHRHLVFNRSQGVWMSWERKRGKLLDLNNLISGKHDAFPVKGGPVEKLPAIRYVITLDADTQLPRGSAARLIGAISHPLNHAVIDPKRRIVTSGYGILQPRVGIAVRSVVTSRLASIFSGQTGFDMYTRAVSDAYQDLFGEGIFTGKGIYDVATLQAVLHGRFPRNALLSHDLIEGAYARAGLATDIEVIDDYPSHYSAYSRRQHRWTRGDWQIVQWITSQVPDESRKSGPNPISAISRWKIFDNLRRSLVDPAFLLLFIAGWLFLPGGPRYWTIAGLCLLFFPVLMQLALGLTRPLARGDWHGCAEVFSSFGRAALFTLLHLTFLFHQTLLTIDAVIRSLVRRFITGERLLEWETAAQSELQSASTGPVDRYLAATPLATLPLPVLIWRFSADRNALFYAACFLAAWALSTSVSTWLNQSPHPPRRLDQAGTNFLLSHALRTWRYFAHFSSERHHFLIPDNVVEDGQVEAPRVSPTNVGLLLNARQAACELGFLTAPEFASLTSQSLRTIARLDKFRGHIYNWYDTETLQPLGDPFISSVDSGNLLASLYTLRAGAEDLQQKSLLHPGLFSSLREHWRILLKQKHPPASLSRIHMPRSFATTSAWIEWLPSAEVALSAAVATYSGDEESSWWLNEMLRRVSAISTLLRDYIPWVLPEFKPLRKKLRVSVIANDRSHSLQDAVAFAEDLDDHLEAAGKDFAASEPLPALIEQLRGLLPEARANLHALTADLRTIEQEAARLAEEMEFLFLVHPDRRVLSIGYDVARQELAASCYDLLASEARLATFLAIARYALPQQSWFRLDREHTFAYDNFLVLSWTGTMFEYLMPALWMRSHPGTLLARTETACVNIQRAFARRRRIPWGISESGSARRNEAGHYGYRAFGVPSVALSPEALAGPVISPYSTLLAVGVDPPNALSNLRRMESEGWVGPYGFYEAADYSISSHDPEIVREWMAHHQGMSLLALTNVLRNDAVKQWFHANPLVQANELVLDELPPSKAALRRSLKGVTAAAGA
jgi:hypothetical protein